MSFMKNKFYVILPYLNMTIIERAQALDFSWETWTRELRAIMLASRAIFSWLHAQLSLRNHALFC